MTSLMAESRKYDASPEHKRICERIQTHKDRLSDYKVKIHKLRRFTLGDMSVFDQAVDQSDAKSMVRDHDDQIGARDILVRTFEVGVTNMMLQSIRTIVHQTAFRFPEIEFEDASPEVAAIQGAYLKQVLGPAPLGCSAIDHQRLQLTDYLTGGVGWVWCSPVKGRNSVVFIDTLDMVWDAEAPTPGATRFAAAFITRTLTEWAETLDETSFDSMIHLLGIDEDNTDSDQGFTLCYYYDILGAAGKHIVYPVDGRHICPSPLAGMEGENPHFVDVAGVRKPFIPFEGMSYLSIVGSRFPTSAAEVMLSPQLAMRQAEKTMARAAGQGGHMEAEEDSYAPAELAKLRSNDPGQIVFRSKGKAPAQFIQGAETDPATAQWHEFCRSFLVSQVGINPYSTGDKVENIKYAAEVNAIQSQASLVAGAIGTDVALTWARIAEKVIANGALYDFNPIRLLYEGVHLDFGPEDPIGDYLEPGITAQVSEDTMQFESKDARIARADRLLDRAIAMAAVAPTAPIKAFERRLRADGIKDVAGWLEPPQPERMAGSTTAGESSADANTQD